MVHISELMTCALIVNCACFDFLGVTECHCQMIFCSFRNFSFKG